MSNNASDMIKINAGGRLFTTSVTTLVMSEALFFHGLLGPTGAQLSSSLTAGPEQDNVKTLFVDCDPDLFEDVLHFMRRKQLRSKTKNDKSKLEDLIAEADFFLFEALQTACVDAMQHQAAPQVRTCYLEISRKIAHIVIEEGEVLYLDTAILVPSSDRTSSWATLFLNNSCIAIIPKITEDSQVSASQLSKKLDIYHYADNTQKTTSFSLYAESDGRWSVRYLVGRQSAIRDHNRLKLSI